MDACRKGIETHIIEGVGLDFTVSISDYDDRIKGYLKRGGRKRTERGNETEILSVIRRDMVRAGILPNSYIGFVDYSDFFSREDDRVAGQTSSLAAAMTLLDRPIRVGRILDGKVIPMNSQERAEYMAYVAGHEAYHLLGRLGEREQVSHRSNGLVEREDCLGYSRFQIPAVVCEGCRDGIRALWYGVQVRTGKKFLM